MLAAVRGIVQALNLIAEGAGRIHDNAGCDAECWTCFDVFRDQTGDAARLLRQLADGRIVQANTAEVDASLHQIDEQPRIIKVGVEIGDAAAKSARLERGNRLERLVAGKPSRAAQAVSSREPIVGFHAESVIRSFPALRRAAQ